MKTAPVTCSLEFIATHRATSALLPISVWVLPLRCAFLWFFFARFQRTNAAAAAEEHLPQEIVAAGH